jgi:hypothetical protein
MKQERQSQGRGWMRAELRARVRIEMETETGAEARMKRFQVFIQVR